MFNKIKQYRHKVFFQILLANSLIIIIFMFLLFAVLWSYYTEIEVQRKIDANTAILERMETYFNHKQDLLKTAVHDLSYTNKEIMDEIVFSLDHSEQELIEYRLEKYMLSSSFQMVSSWSFFEDYFGQDEDVRAVTLTSEKSLSEKKLYSRRHMDQKSKNTFQISHPLYYGNAMELLGILNVYYDYAGINDLLDSQKEQLKGTVYVYTEEGKLLYSTEGGILLKNINVPSYETSINTIQIDGEKFYANKLVDERSQLMFVGMIPKKEVEQVTTVHVVMLLLTVALASTAITMTYWTMRKYSKRIQSIEQSIKKVQTGDLNVRIPENNNQRDELSTISNSFNKMLEELNRYIDIVFVSEIKQKEAEMRALQSQIDPHFLYNTLEAIRMKAIADGNKTTSEMIVLLTKMFRYSMKNHDEVTIEDEISHVKSYLNLFQIRYPNRLNVVYEIPEHILAYPIPKFILQPIIENYILHGLRKDEYSNLLTIHIEEQKKTLSIRIQDNGIGIESDRLEKIREMLNDESEVLDSLGLSNVHQRIRLKFGDGYGLEINSVEHRGTEVTINILVPFWNRGRETHV
ncbi:sensor histidine kinase [Chengkuizengella sediminis]|uniref:sensor histidine kinase n=1 Tax=Chengkuizengella sediminis TaxID=1885917 RepID=UPI00138A1A2C|nr:sensor histidine kinase [Chengkuizengella sediminis]NDI35931.1 sensor histidine kinase [Chengkuizengella sediminis]